MVEPGTSEDARAVAALVRLAHPGALATEAGVRHRMATSPAEARLLCLKETVGGRVVGWASAGLDWASTTPTDAIAAVTVHPDHRGRGIGGALWEELDRHLEEVGAEVVRGFGTADDATSRFLSARGFRRTSTSTVLAVDPADVAVGDLPEGVSITPAAAFADDRRRLYDVDYATMQDEPGDHDFTGFTLADWERETFDHPDFDPSLSMVASIAGEPVGLTLVYADRVSGHAANGGTGVLPAHRGRGIGLALKRRGLAATRKAGIGRVTTTNDETNAAMLAINRRLGFRPFATSTAWRRG